MKVRTRIVSTLTTGLLASALCLMAMPTQSQIGSVTLRATDMSGAALAGGVAETPRLDTDYLDQRANRLMRKHSLTGLAIAVVENGEITFSSGYGVRDAQSREKVSSETVFRWASVSKGVAAAALLGIVESNDIDPEAPLLSLAPSLALPPTDYEHSIVDLLSHRIGITRNAYDTRIEDGRSAKQIRRALGNLNYICDPGSCHTYQNVAYDAASEIIESATDLPYKTVVKRDIFEPLGMKTASLTRDGLMQSENWARPHSRTGRRINRLKPDYYRVPAAAGVNSSVNDLARWMIGLMPDEDGVLPEMRLAAMQAPIVRTPREQRFINRRFGGLRNSHYGLGLRIYDYHGRKVVGHRGGVEGYRALILFDPEKKSGIAMMWNSPHWQPIGLQMEFLDELYDRDRRDWLQIGGVSPRKSGASGD